ncbi:MAG: hypothetical protein J2P28_05150 [Actinobacteria bacterium]|nr:hypothetical protein [Actinomycetota bacterium]MBO0882050.1 hypothetical protein [Mycobacterium sp.]
MTRLRRLFLAAALSLTAAVGGLLATGPANAQTVVNGSLTFSGPAGESITQGESESFSTSNGDPLVVSTTTINPDNHVHISVTISATEWWDLDFDAPGSSVLAPGTYTDATEYPTNKTGPGLALSGNGRACFSLTGSFTVIDAVFGPQGYVQKFDATFVQHCEGATAAATGEVHISNPPAPPAAPTQAAVSPATRATTSGPGGSSAGSGNSTGGAISPGSGSGTITGSVAVGNAASTTRAVSPALLVGVGFVAWAVFAAIGLGVGLGMPFRHPLTRLHPPR